MVLNKKYFEFMLQSIIKNYKSELLCNKLKTFLTQISEFNDRELIDYLKTNRNFAETIILLLESSRISVTLIEIVQLLLTVDVLECNEVMKIINTLYGKKWSGDLQMKILQTSFYFMKYDFFCGKEAQLVLMFVIDAMKSADSDVSLVAHPIAVQLIEKIIEESKKKEEFGLLYKEGNNLSGKKKKDNKIKNGNNDKKDIVDATNLDKMNNGNNDDIINDKKDIVDATNLDKMNNGNNDDIINDKKDIVDTTNLNKMNITTNNKLNSETNYDESNNISSLNKMNITTNNKLNSETNYDESNNISSSKSNLISSEKPTLSIVNNLCDLFYDEIFVKGNCMMSYIFFVFVRYRDVLTLLHTQKIAIEKFFKIILKILKNGKEDDKKSAYEILNMLHKNHYAEFEDESNRFYSHFFTTVNLCDERLYDFLKIAFNSIADVKGRTNIKTFPAEILRVIDIFIDKVAHENKVDEKRDKLVMDLIHESREDAGFYLKYCNIVLDKFLAKTENKAANEFIFRVLNWAVENDNRYLFERILGKWAVEEFIPVVEQYTKYMGQSWPLLLRRCNQECLMKIVVKLWSVGADELEVFIEHADGSVMGEVFENTKEVLVLRNNIEVFIKLLEKCDQSDKFFDVLIRYYSAYQSRMNDKDIKMNDKDIKMNDKDIKIINRQLSTENNNEDLVEQNINKLSDNFRNNDLVDQYEKNLVDQYEKNLVDQYEKNIVDKTDKISLNYKNHLANENSSMIGNSNAINQYSNAINQYSNSNQYSNINQYSKEQADNNGFPYEPLVCLKIYLKKHREYYTAGISCLCQIIKITDIPGAWDTAFSIVDTWKELVSSQVELITLIAQNYGTVLNNEQWIKMFEIVSQMCKCDEPSTYLSGLYICQEISGFMMASGKIALLWRTYLELCLEIVNDKKDVVAVSGVRLIFGFLLSKYVETCKICGDEFVTILLEQMFELSSVEININVVYGMNKLVSKYGMNGRMAKYMEFSAKCIKSDDEKLVRKTIDSIGVIALKTQDKRLQFFKKAENNFVEGKNSVIDNENSVIDNGNSVIDNGNSVIDNGNSVIDNGNSVIDNGNSVIDNGNSIMHDENSVTYNNSYSENNKIIQNEHADNIICKEFIPVHTSTHNKLPEKISSSLRNTNLIVEFCLEVIPTFTGPRSVFINEMYAVLMLIKFDVTELQKLLAVVNKLLASDSSIFPQTLAVVEKICLSSNFPELALLLFSEWISLNKFDSHAILTRISSIMAVKDWEWNSAIETTFVNLVKGMENGPFNEIIEIFINSCSCVFTECYFSQFVNFFDFFFSYKIEFAESRRTERKLLPFIDLFMRVLAQVTKNASVAVDNDLEVRRAFEIIVLLSTRSHINIRLKSYQFLFVHSDKCYHMLVMRLRKMLSTYYADFTNQGGNLEIMRLSEVVYSLKAMRLLRSISIIDTLKLELNDLLLCQDYNITYNVRECFNLLFTAPKSQSH